MADDWTFLRDHSDDDCIKSVMATTLTIAMVVFMMGWTVTYQVSLEAITRQAATGLRGSLRYARREKRGQLRSAGITPKNALGSSFFTAWNFKSWFARNKRQKQYCHHYSRQDHPTRRLHDALNLKAASVPSETNKVPKHLLLIAFSSRPCST